MNEMVGYVFGNLHNHGVSINRLNSKVRSLDKATRTKTWLMTVAIMTMEILYAQQRKEIADLRKEIKELKDMKKE